MDAKMPVALHSVCHTRVPSCIAPPHSQLLPIRRHRPATCHAATDSQPSAPVRVNVLTQQYQGLLAPAKPADNGTAGAKSSQSSRTAKQSGKSPSSSPSSGVSNSNERAPSAARSSSAGQQSKSSRPSATGDRPQSRQSGKPARGTESSSSNDSKASKASQIRKKPNNNASSKPKASSAAATQPLILSGKGFGTVAVTPPGNTSTSRKSSSSKTLKLFRFGVEAAAVQKAIQQNGWEDRVEQVEQLSQADVLVAVKCTPGGRHQNLQQGERAAANAKIPFVVIGRQLSKEQFYKALSPHLGVQTPAERAAAAAEAQQAEHDKTFADQWFKTASQIQWGSAVPAAATNAAAALQQHSQQQKLAAQVQVHKQQQQQPAGAASGREGRSSSSRGATR